MDFDGYGLGGAFQKSDLGNILRWCNEELPEKAKKYIERIEELTDTKVKFIGTGAGRENIIIR